MKRATLRKRAVTNPELVMTAFRKTDKPLTAYEILDKLRPQGVSAPPTVYRALGRLIEDGRVHRLDSLNAFVACARPHHGASAMFSICDSCGTAEEFSDPSLGRRLGQWAKGTGFQIDRSVIEVRGLCGDCQ
ncbi:MAG TPA: Fur family transcriptional regulator [Rhodopila sp.]|jgi:Fur family zinc uptake transcriptional regulator